MVSVVVKDGTERPRRLPSVYLGSAQIYAARTTEEVFGRAAQLAVVIERLPSVETYLVQACELDGRQGLYARDLFNRDAFRRKLMREGLRISESPVVTLSDGLFFCEEWGRLSPTFAVIYDIEEPAVSTMTSARLITHLATFHLGDFTPRALAELATACTGIPTFGGADPRALASEIRTSLLS